MHWRSARPRKAHIFQLNIIFDLDRNNLLFSLSYFSWRISHLNLRKVNLYHPHHPHHRHCHCLRQENFRLYLQLQYLHSCSLSIRTLFLLRRMPLWQSQQAHRPGVHSAHEGYIRLADQPRGKYRSIWGWWNSGMHYLLLHGSRNFQMLPLRSVFPQNYTSNDGMFRCCWQQPLHIHQPQPAILSLTLHTHHRHHHRHRRCYARFWYHHRRLHLPALAESDVRHNICGRNHKNAHLHGWYNRFHL